MCGVIVLVGSGEGSRGSEKRVDARALFGECDDVSDAFCATQDGHEPVEAEGDTGGLGVEERIATVGTEKVEFVITSFRRLSVLPSELFVLHADVAFIHDRCSTMEATFREEFVVIKVAIRKPLVFVKRDVLEPLGAVRTHEASRMVGCS